MYMFVNIGDICLWFVLSASYRLLPKAASFKCFWNHEPLHFFRRSANNYILNLVYGQWNFGC